MKLNLEILRNSRCVESANRCINLPGCSLGCKVARVALLIFLGATLGGLCAAPFSAIGAGVLLGGVSGLVFAAFYQGRRREGLFKGDNSFDGVKNAGNKLIFFV